jgi:hypothetical protein
MLMYEIKQGTDSQISRSPSVPRSAHRSITILLSVILAAGLLITWWMGLSL